MFWFKGTTDLELKDSDKYGSYQYCNDYLDPNFGFQTIEAKNNRFETGMSFNISKPLKYATIVFRSKNLCHSGNLPNLGQASASEAEKYSSTRKKFAQASASEAEK